MKLFSVILINNFIYLVTVADSDRSDSSRLYPNDVVLGGLGVQCSPRDPRFAGSNQAELEGFFQDVKILSTSPPGGTLGWSEISGSLKNLKPKKIGL